MPPVYVGDSMQVVPRTMVNSIIILLPHTLLPFAGRSQLYGIAAVNVLTAWAKTLAIITGNSDRFLAAELYGYQVANAAKIMRDFPCYSKCDRKAMQALLRKVFYSMNHDSSLDTMERQSTTIGLIGICATYSKLPLQAYGRDQRWYTYTYTRRILYT